MDYRVEEAKYVRDYVVWVRFRDGISGEVDLSDELHGEVFEPLLDLTYFKNFTIHPELHTLTWENGADFSPEFLYESVKEAA